MTERLCPNPSNIWIDCDPGIDDAVMLALLASMGNEWRVCGISAVAGNVPLATVTSNITRLAGYFNLPDVPLCAGASEPMARPVQDAAEVHGANGLGGVELPDSDRQLSSVPAVIALREAICTMPPHARMTIVATGPLTNVALFLRTCPDVLSRVERIVLMGGSTVGGNVTPCAEFNIWEDPEAARIVFSSGVSIVMCGLDVTLQCGLTSRQLDELSTDPNERCRSLAQMLSFYKPVDSEWEHGVCVIHDATTILYLTNPELFDGDYVAVEVDCGEEHRGETHVAEPTAGRDANVLLLNKVNMIGFQQELLARLHAL